MNISIVSCSLDPHSRSTQLAACVKKCLQKLVPTSPIEWIELANLSLPFANGANQSAYLHPEVKLVHDKLAKSQGIILASPIYNYDVSASCKNLIELTGFKYQELLSGTAWYRKVIGFIGASGSARSYMAPLGLFNSLLLDFKSHILPDFVLASSGDFVNDIPSEDLSDRLEAFSHEFLKITEAFYIPPRTT